MIIVNWDQVQGEIGAIVKRFYELPRWAARKHLKAAVNRTLRPGIPKLRALTPPLNTRRGRRKKGEKPRTTSALRKSIKTRTAFKSSKTGGVAYGVIGYGRGPQSQKALWLEFGTKYIEARRMAQTFMESYRPVAQGRLAYELKQALDKAVKEVASNVKAVRQANAGTYRRAGR